MITISLLLGSASAWNLFLPSFIFWSSQSTLVPCQISLTVSPPPSFSNQRLNFWEYIICQSSLLSCVSQRRSECSKVRFLSLITIGIWNQMMHCCGNCPVIIGCLSACIASTHWIPVSFPNPFVTKKKTPGITKHPLKDKSPDPHPPLKSYYTKVTYTVNWSREKVIAVLWKLLVGPRLVQAICQKEDTKIPRY